MGWIITTATRPLFKYSQNRPLLKFAGILLGISLISSSGLFAWFVIRVAQEIHPLCQITLSVLLLASCFAGKSLRVAAEEVLVPLVAQKLYTIGLLPFPLSQYLALAKPETENNLNQARQKLSGYVGRDTQNLSEAEILRAVLETVTENAVDGVTAPLIWAIAGALIPGIGPVPLAFAYKAASTLDSMIGYKQSPYTDIGWFSAKFEDCLTWLPCRLTVITLALYSGKPWQVWQICQRDAPQDPSPNSGWSECVYAAILGVQLGGINTYQGIIKQKPLLGDALFPITPEKILQALTLTRFCCLTSLFLAAIGLGLRF